MKGITALPSRQPASPTNETYPYDITSLRLIDKQSGRSSTVLLAQVAPSLQSVYTQIGRRRSPRHAAARPRRSCLPDVCMEGLGMERPSRGPPPTSGVDVLDFEIVRMGDPTA